MNLPYLLDRQSKQKPGVCQNIEIEDSKLGLCEGKRESEICYIENEVKTEDSKLDLFEVKRETDSSENECNMLMSSNTYHYAHVNIKIEKDDMVDVVHATETDIFNVKFKKTDFYTDLPLNDKKDRQTNLNRSENNGEAINCDKISKLISCNKTEEKNKQTQTKCYKYKFGEKEFSFKFPVVSVDKNLPMMYMLNGDKRSGITSPDDQSSMARQGFKNDTQMESDKSEFENLKKLNKSESEKPVSVVLSSFNHQVSCQMSPCKENEITKMIPHKCKFCNKDFLSKFALRSHIKLHTESEGFVSYLPKQPRADLKTSDENKNHIIGKVYNCFLCKKVFTIESAMIRHIKLHKEKRKHRCKTCGKGFNQKHQLQKHEVIHTECKLFMCDSCQISFKNVSELKQHIRNI
ncbi:KRAB [Mytilus edulis]|uniref:KRAB n=1 Tax=Mytilus edulis TaxID=6550 RepID=A0A8S3PPH5_MYTED|nr:KRAB [Mytilus edulis]